MGEGDSSSIWGVKSFLDEWLDTIAIEISAIDWDLYDTSSTSGWDSASSESSNSAMRWPSLTSRLFILFSNSYFIVTYKST